MFQHHHHHVTCINCGTVQTLKEDKALEEAIARLSSRNFFTAIDHQLEIRGLCRTCSKTTIKT